MTKQAAAATPNRMPETIPAWMILLLATACGLIVANLYYAQPLIGLIAPAVGLAPAAASLIVTLSQLGYCAGLVLLVPLGDLVENRRLTLLTLGGVILALLMAATAPSAAWFLAASLAIGLGSVAVQMLVPLAAHLAPDAIRGRVVGNVMGGLLLGLMLARPVASLVADDLGWRFLFGAAAVVMAGLTAILRLLLPQRHPAATHSYATLIGSLWTLLRRTPVLRRRAAYQASLFAAFSLFWSAVPLELAGPQFRLTQRGIALFALAGAAGAIAAPIAGRIADRGWSRIATGASLALVAAAFLLAWLGSGSVVALATAGVLLDFGVQSNLVLGQRAIYALGAETRSRLNGIYMAIFFGGGAIGSAVASLAYARGGWVLVSRIGLAIPIAALLLYATEFLRPGRPR
jgi:predicted MFS family arabinose efflux permease